MIRSIILCVTTAALLCPPAVAKLAGGEINNIAKAIGEIDDAIDDRQEEFAKMSSSTRNPARAGGIQSRRSELPYDRI